jgi:hypothetical protein
MREARRGRFWGPGGHLTWMQTVGAATSGGSNHPGGIRRWPGGET